VYGSYPLKVDILCPISKKEKKKSQKKSQDKQRETDGYSTSPS
jgi:hypothetical protein